MTTGPQSTGGATTLQAWTAGVGSTFPDPSVARTSNRWEPIPSPVHDAGLVHGMKPAPSRRHSKVSAPTGDRSSLPANVNAAVESSVLAGGPEVIAVSGAVTSGSGSRTVHR